jgi:hypothetical protein
MVDMIMSRLYIAQFNTYKAGEPLDIGEDPERNPMARQVTIAHQSACIVKRASPISIRKMSGGCESQIWGGCKPVLGYVVRA